MARRGGKQKGFSLWLRWMIASFKRRENSLNKLQNKHNVHEAWIQATNRIIAPAGRHLNLLSVTLIGANLLYGSGSAFLITRKSASLSLCHLSMPHNPLDNEAFVSLFNFFFEKCLRSQTFAKRPSEVININVWTLPATRILQLQKEVKYSNSPLFYFKLFFFVFNCTMHACTPLVTRAVHN